MRPVQRIFLISLAFVATLGAALGSFLFISLIPYFSIVGKATVSLVIIGLCCVAAILITFTYTRIDIFFARLKSERLRARLLVSGDVVVLVHTDGRYDHLSALHEAAKIPRMLPAPQHEEAVSDDTTVIEFYNDGMTLETIMEATNLKYNKVQRIVAEAKKAGKIAR